MVQVFRLTHNCTYSFQCIHQKDAIDSTFLIDNPSPIFSNLSCLQPACCLHADRGKFLTNSLASCKKFDVDPSEYITQKLFLGLECLITMIRRNSRSIVSYLRPKYFHSIVEYLSSNHIHKKQQHHFENAASWITFICTYSRKYC